MTKRAKVHQNKAQNKTEKKKKKKKKKKKLPHHKIRTQNIKTLSQKLENKKNVISSFWIVREKAWTADEEELLQH